MVTLASLPCWITLLVFTCHPCTSCSIHKVLCTEDVYRKEQLWIFNRTVNMTFCSKVYEIVNVIFSKEFVGKFTITNITLYKDATLVINIILDSTEVTSIGKRIEDNNLNIFIHVLLMK